MLSDTLRLLLKLFTILPPYLLTYLHQRLSARLHLHTYTPLPPSVLKTVLVIGGSFAGHQLTKRLSETLPTGYRVVLIERNTHLNWLFGFPRFSVVPGYEEWAFIPYEGLGKGRPRGICERVCGSVEEVRRNEVLLGDGEVVGFEYAVVATGTSASLPNKVSSTDKEGGKAELRKMQGRIGGAKRIAVVGGGAVGVEFAGDIKETYREKEVVLFHSRERLLNTFGKRLSDYTMKVFGELGVKVLLNERPVLIEENDVWKIEGEKGEEFDLVMPCTGQRPNSSLIAGLSATSISSKTSRILVEPTLQIVDPILRHIFAIGDVAATGGPKMARAALLQSEIVVQNILAMIHGKTDLKTYKPNLDFEGGIKLTLGKIKTALYSINDKGEEILVELKGQEDMGVKSQWRFFGADVKKVETEAQNM